MHLDNYLGVKRVKIKKLPKSKDRYKKTNIRLVGYANEYLVALGRYFINPVTKRYGNDTAALLYCVEYCAKNDIFLESVWLETSPKRFAKDKEGAYEGVGEWLTLQRGGDETSQFIKKRELSMSKTTYDYLNGFRDPIHNPMFRGIWANIVSACVMTVVMEIMDGVNPDFKFERRVGNA